MQVQWITRIGEKKRATEWLPIFLVRLFLGIFLLISGFYDLVDQQQQKKLLDAMTLSQLPYPHLLSIFFPLITLIGGLLLVIGLLTTCSSFFLFIIMICNFLVSGLSKAKVSQTPGVFYIENFPYLPELLSALLLLWLLFAGPGKISLDYRMGNKKSSPFQ